MVTNTFDLETTKLNLPLFIISRIRFQESHARCKLESYITKNKNFYIQEKRNGNDINNKSHILKKMKSQGQCKITTRSLERGLSNEKSWQMPPNIYDINKIPFESRTGRGGAHWSKLNNSKSKVIPAKRITYKFYDLPRETEKMNSACHKQKSVFLSNARERNATSRCMISNPLTCYKDPNFPAPNYYQINEPTKKYKRQTPLNPHIFYRNSIVPLKENKIHASHISFSPGPGRYETRYRNICSCSSKLIYQPNLQWLIDINKRFKFRRLPYQKIIPKLYCSPDFRHVRNAGHRHVFQGAKPYEKIKQASNEASKHKIAHLYADSKYISMINNATSDLVDIRKKPMPQLPPRIVYNSMIKLIKRKQLRTNKKIAFSSGVQRWKDNERPLVLTTRQLEELKNKLPMERQLRDHPIMTKDIEEISGKLTKTPKHMMPHYVPKLRKRLFKFQPIPQAKVLVTDSDTSPMIAANQGYYYKPLEAKDYFKDAQ